MIIVSTVAFIQEYRAEKTLEALNTLVPINCNVTRNGQIAHINAEELVPGDIITLHSGDRVPADARIITCANLFVDESAMTGETHPREKSAAAIPDIEEDAGIHDKANVIFMGTLICSGNCTAVVSTTGILTEFGKTFQDTRDVEKSKTPLQVICYSTNYILTI